MNKKLIALAVAGATFVPAAMAQSANPVTLYGRVAVTFESVKAIGSTAPAANIGGRNRVNDNSSLFGIRGTEDLGGGLKAFFQFETAFKPDQNDTAFAGRNSGVGLQGDWGSILLGRWDTPFKQVANTADVFGDIWIAGYNGVMSDRANFDRREQNVAQYWSPTINGFSGRLSYATNEGKTIPTTVTQTGQVNPSSISMNVMYSQGPLVAGYSWEKHKDQYRNGNVAAGGTSPAVAGGDERGQELFGAVTFGPIKVGVLAQKYKKNSGVAAQTVTDQKSNMANITYTAGKNQFVYQYAKSKDGDISTAAVQPNSHSSAIGYFYNFTKRTTFVAHYISIKNNVAAKSSFGANPLAVNADGDPRGLGVGFRHLF